MDNKGNHYGLGPTIEEIDHLSKLFKRVYHCAPLHKGTPPKSFKRHDSKNVKHIPLAPAEVRISSINWLIYTFSPKSKNHKDKSHWR